MTPEPLTLPGYRFPAKVIRFDVWLYHLFGLSPGDVDLILAERGRGTVTHGSIQRWTIRSGADFSRRLHRCRPKPSATGHLDEVFPRSKGGSATSGAL